ncbi:hypothetical protein CCHR01_01132 [Colletotrichum chrysophilum]|uniref:Uncharacterized protein n=1 Tax=Colletotrichum chrysophilum TaxID=1836956 RepID=A0AAD9AZM5_9PEZI|nr:hypothetical protein CCHR01_01132 [Colletotrichum chrysophilum]
MYLVWSSTSTGTGTGTTKAAALPDRTFRYETATRSVYVDFTSTYLFRLAT